jgi:hypothetical protein
MQNTSPLPRLTAGALCCVLLACGATAHAPSGPAHVSSEPSGPEDLTHFVLIIQEAPNGSLSHAWRPVSGFNVAPFLTQSTAPTERGTFERSIAGRIVLAAWNRDCEAERDTCEDNCMDSDLGPAWSHIRTTGAKRAECRNRCWRPYLDCCRLRDLEGEEFRAIDDAVDWLKRHRREVLVGTTVVIAGVAFVAVVAGTGGAALILMPAVLLTSSAALSEPHLAAAQP